MEWVYGITTIPQRRNTLLPKTITSLTAGGFNNPRIFVDGANSKSGFEFSLPLTIHDTGVKAVGNWILSIWELYLRNPKADRYVLFQDDILLSKNVRQYLEWCDYPERGYLNLCTYPQNAALAKGNTGWYPSNQFGRGAQALVFSQEAMRVLLQQRWLTGRLHVQNNSDKGIDGMVCKAMTAGRYKEFVHFPSLVDHVGKESTLGNPKQPEIKSFNGENFDAMSLTMGAKIDGEV